MKKVVEKLESLITKIEDYFSTADEAMLRKSYIEGIEGEAKWSRKQILGHLIDSAVNNLTRFTEIDYQLQPYIYREYNQSELVKINEYQNMETAELLQLWLSLNKQILRVMKSATEERLNLKIKFADGSLSDLRYIMTDYPAHMQHHINQILS